MGGGGGGGVGSPPRRFPPAPPTAARFRLAAVGAVLAGLAALTPPAAVAQTCTPTGYTGTLPKVAYDGAYTETITCQTLTGGLEMTLGPDLKLGTEASPLTDRGVLVDAEGDGNNDIVVMGSGRIYTNQSGIEMRRDGTGLLKLEFTAGQIVSGGSTDGVGIFLQHKGEAGQEAKGIHLVSGADIDLSAQTSDAKVGIHATTEDAPADATIPIEIRVTGGTVDVSDPASSSPTVGGSAIKADQYAKGDVAITVEKAARLGTKEAIAGAYGIEAWLRAASEGDIAITHRGSIHAGEGIFVRSDATSAEKGSIAITTEAGSTIVAKEFKDYSTIYEDGISARIEEAASTGDITITHNGAMEAGKRGIYTYNRGEGSVTVTTGASSKIVAGTTGMEVRINKATSTGAITITHKGEIDADGRGIYATNGGTGAVTVTTGTGSQIAAGGDGMEAGVSQATGTGTVTITHKGAIDAGRIGIFTYNYGTGDVTVTTGPGSQIIARGDASSSGLNASVRGAAATGDVTVLHRGEIISTGAEGGIYVSNRNTSDKGTGTLSVTTAAGSKVAAEKQGILVWHRGTGKAYVTVRGAVMGDDAYTSGSETTYAGVHIQVKATDPRAGGGGEIVLGPRGHVSAKSGVAIKIDQRAGTWTLLLEEDQDGLTGHIEGEILNEGEVLSEGTVLSKNTEDAGTTMIFKARDGETGPERTLSVGDSVNMRGETQGIYDKVYGAQLMRTTGGHEFKKLSETLIYHDRSRVYEALPAVLLDLNGQLPYQERMAAPRDGDGLWARLAAGDGARRPARSTTARGFTGRALAWDVAQYGFEGGLDFRPAATERLLLGVSLHARQGTATVAHGGTIEVSGFGGGVSATYRDAAGFYLDGRFSYTYFDDVDLTSRTRGMVQSDLSGHGYALGLEAGKRLGWTGLDHVALTPRARVVWSTVKLEDFADLAGSGRVALETATSLKGRLGLLTETAFGGATLKDWTGDGGRLFGSLDVEHEFSVDRETRASGTALASEVRATWGRVGLGGTLIWHDGLTLSGEGFYATAGSNNTDFGGSLTLTLGF